MTKAIIEQESHWNNGLTSQTGNKGLGQLSDHNAKYYGVKDVWDPRENIKGTIHLFSDAMKYWQGNTWLAVGEYHAGRPAIIRNGNKIPNISDGGIRTPQYVAQVHRRFRK